MKLTDHSYHNIKPELVGNDFLFDQRIWLCQKRKDTGYNVYQA
jgi:hypothetical protein